MVKTAIDKSKWKEKYERNATAASHDLVEGYVARTDKVARMSSDDAQKNFETAMKDPNVLKRRQKKLKGLSEEDLNNAMRTKGEMRYSEGITASADKALSNVTPYLDEIDKIKTTMKPRTRDPRQNVMDRVIPIAVGLRDKKDRMS